jgi:hemerythrin-like domain-containing protein
VKRVAPLRDLSDDHHTGLVLARRCRTAGEPHERVWDQVREAFSSHLEPHFQIEERHLLPALVAIGEATAASRIREDHAALRDMLKAKHPDRALLGQFGELLESHIRFEERQVFERTQHRLPPHALEAIAAACRDTPRTCSVALAD